MIPWIANSFYFLALLCFIGRVQAAGFLAFALGAACWAYWAGFGVGSELLFVAYCGLTVTALYGFLTRRRCE